MEFDLLDLKVALLYHGICVDEEVYEAFEGKARLSKNPFSCNAMILDEQIFCSLSRTEQETPFRLTLNDGNPVITYNNKFLTEISFPKKTSFYEQKTSSGIPFGNLAVIQGLDMLAFACLWRCEITTSGNACGFCHTGNFASPDHSLSEMMEIIRYAVEESPKTKMLQLTAGSTFNPEKEIDQYVKILEAIDKSIGIEKVPTMIYLTPPSDLKQLDRLFDAGVSQIACDMDIWDERLFEKICPGKAKVNTRQRYLDALSYIAEKYGPNRACCVFVGGIEPAESLIEGATFLAEQGIVPLPSPLMPFGVNQKVLAEMQPFSLDYYRKIRKETAKLYQKHNLIVPGTYGSDVCLSRDIWLRREILASE
ncbi:MAG: radical SAM protein [Bacteroidales bacterium]|nr:radical SAM protein [Bacteroidales bacterium]